MLSTHAGVATRRFTDQSAQYLSGVTHPSVAIRHQGRSIGLYRVRRVGDEVIVLSHGGISFPVGTRLLIEDYQGLIPGAPARGLAAMVIANDFNGISLAW